MEALLDSAGWALCLLVVTAMLLWFTVFDRSLLTVIAACSECGWAPQHA